MSGCSISIYRDANYVAAGCPRGGFVVTNLSCCSFAANAVRQQLHTLAYNLAIFLRALAVVTLPRDLLRRIFQMIDGLRSERTARC